MQSLDTDDSKPSCDIQSDSDESCYCFSLSEIQSATNNFDDALVIGIGGFGKVFKGSIDINGALTTVAIKRLNIESKQGAQEFWTEVKMLTKLRHNHLVTLIGYCNDSQEMILVYEYIARGTVADHLYNKTSNCEGNGIGVRTDSDHRLSWEQRIEICIGGARGLDYLHTGTDQSFIHRDVKTTNILLDHNWVAKISDFGLSKGITSLLTTHVSTDVKGTFGYLDPDYFVTRRLTKKSDVYAYGVVMLEMLSGRPPVDSRPEIAEEEISLVNWAQHCFKKGKFQRIIDPSLSGQISPRCLKCFVELATRCLQKAPKERPTMAEVVSGLENALVAQQKGRTKGIITKGFHGIEPLEQLKPIMTKAVGRLQLGLEEHRKKRPSGLIAKVYYGVEVGKDITRWVKEKMEDRKYESYTSIRSNRFLPKCMDPSPRERNDGSSSSGPSEDRKDVNSKDAHVLGSES